ncbi:MAG: hypothetical protein PVF58_19675 [Candidatus Methanofastidiosia archaeon]|jgi:hypothetical protein
MEKNDISTILYKIEGNDISIQKAPAELIGNILLNFQGLIFSLGQYYDEEAHIYGRRTRSIEDKYKLKVSFEKGSLILRMSPYYEDLMLYPPEDFPQQKYQQEVVFYKLREILISLQEKKEDYRSRVKDLIPEHKERFTIFNYLNELLPKENFKTSIIFFNSHEETTSIVLNENIFKNRVSTILKEEFDEDRIKIEGVVVRLKDDSPNPVFWVKTFEGKLSKISLYKEQRAKIIKYLSERIPIRLYGIGTMRKHAEILEIDAIEKNNEILVDQIRGNRLKEPIKAEISFEKYDKTDDFWIVKNEKLGAVGVDKTVKKAKEEFEEDLYAFYQFYKRIPDNELTERTKMIKEKLLGIFEQEN